MSKVIPVQLFHSLRLSSCVVFSATIVTRLRAHITYTPTENVQSDQRRRSDKYGMRSTNEKFSYFS